MQKKDHDIKRNTEKYFQEIIKKINNYDVISFDIFDTLVKRNVAEPKEIFSLVEKKYNQDTNLKLSDFKSQRIDAEIKARKNTALEEVTLAEIYLNLVEYKDCKKEKLMKFEEQIEVDMVCKNQIIEPIYKWCINNGKTVILTSDMYLPQQVLERMLIKCKIKNYFKLYVSSELMKTKKTGSLFQYILNDLQISNRQMIHIGDSFKSDVKSPRKIGIKAIKISENSKRNNIRYSDCYIQKKDRIYYSCLESFLKNNTPLVEDEYYQFGYKIFGMFLWGFVKWLNCNLQKKGITKVYFFSRDGYIIKKAFELLNKQSGMETHYLQVSRRSLRVPVLWLDSRYETLIGMISTSSMISIIAFFDAIGLDINKYLILLKKYGFNLNSKFSRKNILENGKLKNLYEELKVDVIQNSKIEYKNLKLYLEANDFKGKVAIVDIGWTGGMQRYLLQAIHAMEIDAEIIGYYIGITEGYKRNMAIMPLDLNGYLFNCEKETKYGDLRSSFVGLFETFFLERDGSVKKYFKEKNLICAYRYPYEYCEHGILSKEANSVSQIQQGAMDFMIDIEKIKIFDEAEFSALTLFACLKMVGSNPCKKDLRMFSEFRFFDEGIVGYLAKPQSLVTYLRFPLEFKMDFFQCRWKIGFMKKLFKIPFPYECLYQFLLKYK